MMDQVQSYERRGLRAEEDRSSVCAGTTMATHPPLPSFLSPLRLRLCSRIYSSAVELAEPGTDHDHEYSAYFNTEHSSVNSKESGELIDKLTFHSFLYFQ